MLETLKCASAMSPCAPRMARDTVVRFEYKTCEASNSMRFAMYCVWEVSVPFASRNVSSVFMTTSPMCVYTYS